MREQSILIQTSARGQTISVSGTSAQAAAFPETEAYICATVDCFCIAGDNPTATTSCTFIPANIPLRLYGWKPGQKLAFITGGGTGTVYLTPGA